MNHAATSPKKTGFKTKVLKTKVLKTKVLEKSQWKEKALKKTIETEPDLVVGSPMCKDFSVWQRYNKAHKQERAAHNKTYVQREEVKARRRFMNRQRALEARADVEQPAGQDDETAR